MNSVLEETFIEPERPFSQKELLELRNKIYRNHHLSKVFVKQTDCGHCYFVKSNGKKEKEVMTKPDHKITGNCSVCWKLHKTPKNLKKHAEELVYEYTESVNSQLGYLAYELIELERCFYTWLYYEFVKPREEFNKLKGDVNKKDNTL